MSLDGFFVPLFVPGDRPDRFAKAAISGADAIIIDLEDAVAPRAKQLARASLQTKFPSIPILVRINGEGTEWFREDIAAISGLPIAGIMIPRAELGGNLEDFANTSQVPVFALIETVLGLSQARQIAKVPGIARLAFGSIDFCVDASCAHTREALLSARWELVMACRLAGLPAPIDGVTTSIDDDDLIAVDARASQELGFAGKLAIHPRQIAPIRRGFRPDEEEIEWAKKVLRTGDGALALEGVMIDRPVRERATSILSRASISL